jgi:hypothetical protein
VPALVFVRALAPDFDFLAVEQEQEAKQAKLDEIRQLLLERYRIVKWKRRGWMTQILSCRRVFDGL